MAGKKIFRKILSFALVLIFVLSTFVIVMPTSTSAVTQNQQNIVDRANYLWNSTWVCKKTVKGWNSAYTFSAGSTYRLPYGQPIYSGKYIGYGVSVDEFLKSTQSASSVFYTSRSKYQKSSTYYATDCSAFVAWCWGTSRQTTYSIPNISTCIGGVTTSNATNKLQLGDCLNSSPHVVLVTGLKYNASGAITQIEITEQTPPQLKKTTYTPSGLASKYGGSYKIYRYNKSVPAAPSGSTYVGGDEFYTSQLLVQGDNGIQVEYMQQALNALGYGPLTVDGGFGAKTLAAVKAYQTDNGLTVDGKAGQNTLTSLKNKVVAVQNNLKKLNYYTGSIDGMFGEKSIAALKSFQKAKGLSQTGVADTATLNALTKAVNELSSGSSSGSTSSGSTSSGNTSSGSTSSGSTSSGNTSSSASLDLTIKSKLNTNQLLVKGSTGDQVRYMQQILKIFGYLDGAADGSFGNATLAAVKAYQNENGLAADGQAGSKTLTSMKNKGANLQINLKKLGYYHGTIDVALGDGTLSALKSFQTVHKLTVDGVAGPNTLNEISKSIAKLNSSSSSSGSTSSGSTSSGSTSSGSTSSGSSSSTTTTPAKFETNQSLKQGSTGIQVEYLQKALVVFGHLNGSIDGSFGAKTLAAVKEYQRENGLTVDGNAGPNTLNSLVGKAKKLQQDLKKLGYYNGSIDGVLGDATVSAVKAYQRANSLTVDGIVGPNTETSIYFDVNPVSNVAGTGYDRGYKGGMAGTGKVWAQGLDVSSWQSGNIDFKKVKAAGYTYVILRAGTTKGKDSCFDKFYNEARSAGLLIGAYYYSYATTVSAAEKDANNMLSWIKGKTFEYPIYFDYEDPSQTNLSKTTAKNICLRFMDMIAAKGYLSGMYTGQYKSTQLPMSEICAKYEFWVAHYYDNTYTSLNASYSKKYGMYQYTSKKYVSGKGPYDANVSYKDYPTIVKTYGFNGYAPNSK